MKTVGFITKKRKAAIPRSIGEGFMTFKKGASETIITHRLKYDGKNINGEPVLYGGVPEVYAVKEN